MLIAAATPCRKLVLLFTVGELQLRQITIPKAFTLIYVVKPTKQQSSVFGCNY